MVLDVRTGKDVIRVGFLAFFPPGSTRNCPVPQHREILVVGAGILGLSVTRELARRGRDVICLEQATVGHERAGSKGNSRIFRLGYDDPLYVYLAMRALPGWTRLGEEAGVSLLEPVGLLSFGERVDDVSLALRESGAFGEVLLGEELSETFPGLAVRGKAVYEPAAGVLRVAEILSVLSQPFAGSEITEGIRVVGIEEGGAGVRVRTAGDDYEAEVVVLCAGAWTGEMAAKAGIDALRELRPSVQQVAYLRTRPAFTGKMPAFVERGPVTYYGVPVPDRDLYKIGLHDAIHAIDPATADLSENDVTDLGLLTEMAVRLLPGCEPELVETERCLYDNTPDEDFVIDRVGRVVIGGGTSGHGFKFGPVFGEVLADLAEGRDPEVPLDRFRLDRFG